MPLAESNIFPMTKRANIQVGHIRGSTYFITRNYKRGQIFRAPRYDNGIGIDRDIIKKLMLMGIKKINLLVVGYERKSFRAEIAVEDYIKFALGHYDYGHGRQYITPMRYFNRLSNDKKQAIQAVLR